MLQYLPLIAQCTKKSDTPEIIMQHKKMKLKFYLKIKNLLTYLLTFTLAFHSQIGALS